MKAIPVEFPVTWWSPEDWPHDGGFCTALLSVQPWCLSVHRLIYACFIAVAIFNFAKANLMLSCTSSTLYTLHILHLLRVTHAWAFCSPSISIMLLSRLQCLYIWTCHWLFYSIFYVCFAFKLLLIYTQPYPLQNKEYHKLFKIAHQLSL